MTAINYPTHLLSCLLVVAEAGSLTEAAKRLHMTQSAVTRQIDRLERALGLRLLRRHPRGVELTEAGVALLPHARACVLALESLRDQAHRLTAGAAADDARSE